MKVDIKVIGIEEVKKKLANVKKDKWPAILSSAATETAFYVRNKVRKEMPSYIDRPKPFTLNSIFVRKGKTGTGDIDASVEWRKPASGNSGGRYLRPTVEGGSRHQTGFEKKLTSMGLKSFPLKVVPTRDASKDVYGNVPGAYYRRVISSLTASVAGTQKGKGRTKQSFFAVSQRDPKLRRGIYERRETGFGTAIRRVFSFISKVSYKKSFPFYDIGVRASTEKFPEKFDEAIARALEGKL